MFKNNKFLILSSVVLISSLVVYQSFKNKQKLNKEKRLRILEAILVDPDYN